MKKPRLKTARREPIQVGDTVKLLVDKEAYYSGYSGNPVVIIKAGTLGSVGAVNVPAVWRKKNEAGVYVDPPDFNCIDFVVPETYQGNPKFKHNIWRCAVRHNELVLVSRT